MAGGWTGGQTDRQVCSPAEPRGLPALRVPAGGGGQGEGGHAHLGALVQQRLHEGAADALRPAGDQRHLPIDVHGPALLPGPAGPPARSAFPSPFSLLLPSLLPSSSSSCCRSPPVCALEPPGRGEQGRSGAINRPAGRLEQPWGAGGTGESGLIPSAHPRSRGPGAATAPLPGEGGLGICVCVVCVCVLCVCKWREKLPQALIRAAGSSRARVSFAWPLLPVEQGEDSFQKTHTGRFFSLQNTPSAFSLLVPPASRICLHEKATI